MWCKKIFSKSYAKLQKSVELKSVNGSKKEKLLERKNDQKLCDFEVDQKSSKIDKKCANLHILHNYFLYKKNKKVTKTWTLEKSRRIAIKKMWQKTQNAKSANCTKWYIFFDAKFEVFRWSTRCMIMLDQIYRNLSKIHNKRGPKMIKFRVHMQIYIVSKSDKIRQFWILVKSDTILRRLLRIT